MEMEMEKRRVAVVTGGNRGLGLAVVRALAEAEGEQMVVVMGARDPVAGARACAQLKLDNVVFHELDVQDPSSIACLAAWLQSSFGGLDILVNNAAISGGSSMDNEAITKYNLALPQEFFDSYDASKTLDYELAKSVIDTNYYGAVRIIETLLPLFKASSMGSHIINVSSGYGQLRHLPNESLRQKFMDVGMLTKEFVDKILEEFLGDLKEGKLEERMWPTILFPAYKMSKIALNTYTRILARDLEIKSQNNKIFVNVMNPGYMKTDMNFNTGKFTTEESAHDLVWVVLHNHNPPLFGQFLYLKKPSDFN